MAKKTEQQTGERIYTIPLRREWIKAPRNKRGNRAVSAVRAFLIRHMHASDARLSQRLNETIWTRGIQKPPSKVKVKVNMQETIAIARLPEELVLEKEKKEAKGLKERIAEARGKGEESQIKESAGLGKSETAVSKHVVQKAGQTPEQEKSAGVDYHASKIEGKKKNADKTPKGSKTPARTTKKKES